MVEQKQIADPHFERMAAKNRLPTRLPKVTTRNIVNHYIMLAKEGENYQ